MKIIYLVRHAETEFNCLGNKFIGGQSNNIKLTEKGKLQAKILGRFLSSIRYDINKIYCSDSLRTVNTFEILNAELGINKDSIIFTEKLREQSQGEWEGKVRAEIRTPEMLEEIMKDCFNHRAPGGESQADVEKRVFELIDNEILSSENNNTVMLVTHGNTVRCTLRKILGSDPLMNIRISVDNASITKIIHDERGWKVEYLNLTSYL